MDFGASVTGKMLSYPALDNFPLIVPEGSMKLTHLAKSKETVDNDSINFDWADKTVSWASSHHKSVRGHFVPGWHLALPDWITELSPKDSMTCLEKIIRVVIGRYPTIVTWDLIHEYFLDSGLIRPNPLIEKINAYLLENPVSKGIDSFPLAALTWATDTNPAAEFLIGDYRPHTLGRWRAILEMIKVFRSRGFKNLGAGVQCYYDLIPSVGIEVFHLDSVLSAIISQGANVHLSEVKIFCGKGTSLFPAALREELQAVGLEKIIKLGRDGGAKSVTFWNPFDQFDPDNTCGGLWDGQGNRKKATRVLR